jgi:hypothetical protein
MTRGNTADETQIQSKSLVPEKKAMNRRKFLKASASGALISPNFLNVIRNEGSHSISSKPGSKHTESSSISVVYTEQDQRRRLLNLAVCEKAIHSCMRKQLVSNYLPGQCSYNLGEYPCRTPWKITEYDVQELDRLKAHGIRLIQLHEEWNDSQRLYGATKFTPLNPAGFLRFLDLAHKRGMKVIVYASSGFFERRDLDFRPEWARDQYLVELFYKYARCSPASPSWRAYVLSHIFRLMDDYGVDGIYNDLGYVPLAANPSKPTSDEILAFPESPTEDGALGDLLAQIYSEVHRRGGLVKVHCGATERPHSSLTLYDYLWVGEEIESGDALRESVKDYPPYVVPCLDMSKARIENEDELYLHSIPYLQFPLLLGGKPFTGERAVIPGVQYVSESEDFWTAHCRKIWKYYKTHPDGPYSYGWWDSVPGRPEAQRTHASWLDLYAPMVEEGTWAWLQVSSSELFRSSLPSHVVVSVFANREIYLVLANYGRTPVTVEPIEAYVSCKQPLAPATTHVHLDPRSLLILKLQPTLSACNA